MTDRELELEKALGRLRMECASINDQVDRMRASLEGLEYVQEITKRRYDSVSRALDDERGVLWQGH